MFKTKLNTDDENRLIEIIKRSSEEEIKSFAFKYLVQKEYARQRQARKTMREKLKNEKN